jgi:serine/threonine protein kinase
MGEVYLAEQLSLGNRLVAVKVVRAERDVTPPSDAPLDAGWHFIREAQLLGQLSHPNILPVYHSGIEAGYLFLVMQYAPDGSLADAIKGKGAHGLDLPASPQFAVDIVAQLADALQYTHDHHVIHSDVKPSNVLVQVEPNGRWHMLLADFGIARTMDSIALRDEVAGTAAYMAPEQFFGHLSPACDQYALGVMAFQLLGGRLPFTGGLVELANAHAREEPPALRTLNPAVSPAIEAVIARALSKRPEDRYRTVADFAQALRAASTGANTTLVAASSPGAVWAGPALGARDATARTAPAATWDGPSSTPSTLEKTVPFVRDPAAAPRARRTTSSGGRQRRMAPGIAVLALLLVTCIAGLSLRSHIDIIHAFSSLGSLGSIAGAGTTPTLPGTHESSSPASSAGAVPTQQGNPVQTWPTPTPTAQVTPQSSPEPTVTTTAEPTATAPSPTAAPTMAPSPAATATGGPRPTATATATAQPTLPAATATPQSSAAGVTGAPSSTQPAQAQPVLHLP